MKIVAVDIGNTETSIGIGNYEKWESFRFTTRTATTSDEWLMMFSSTLPESLRDKKLGSIVCSVVPQVNSDLIQALYDYLGFAHAFGQSIWLSILSYLAISLIDPIHQRLKSGYLPPLS